MRLNEYALSSRSAHFYPSTRSQRGGDDDDDTVLLLFPR